MQKRFLTSLFIVVCSFVQVYGYSDVYYIRKTVIESVNACGPVTVNASVIIATSTSGSGTYGPQKEYYVSAGTTWDEAVEIRSGYDCNGNSVSIHKEVVTKEEQYPNGVRFNGESSVYHYVKYITFYYTIGQGGGYSSSNSSSSSGSSSSNGNLTSSVERAGYTIGHAIGSGIAGVGKTLIKAGNSSAEKERKYGYHPGGFSLSASVSAAWGENLELRWRYGSSTIGGDVTCMVGYDWIRKDGILWNIGAGFSMGDRISEDYLFDVTLGFKLGRAYKAGFSGMLDLSTNQFLGKKHVFGFTAGLGIGLGQGRGFIWDARGGIVIYFLQWDWLYNQR